MAAAAETILIADSYALNLGDVAILMSTVSAFARERPDVGIVIESSHPEFLSRFKEFSGYRVVPRIFDIQRYDRSSSWNWLSVIARGSYDSATFLLWAALRRCGLAADILVRPSRREQARLLGSVAAIVSVGGGFLSSNYNYQFRLYIYLLGMLLGKKVIVFAQSIGPFDSAASRFLIPRFLKRCALVAVREPNSCDYLRRFGLSARCVRTADTAFLLAARSAAWVDDLFSAGRSVAITLKVYADPVRQRTLLDALVETALFLRQKGYGIILVSHVPNTDAMAAELSRLVGAGVRTVPFGADPRELKELYSRCEFVVSCLMHAAVFAGDRHVPFAVISYEPKFLGLLRLLDYDDRLMLDSGLLDRPDFRDTLLAAVSYLEQNRREVADGLAARMPRVRQLAAAGLDSLWLAIGAGPVSPGG